MANVWLNLLLASGKAFTHTAERTVVKMIDKTAELHKELGICYDRATSLTGAEENMLQVLHNRVEDCDLYAEDSESNVDLDRLQPRLLYQEKTLLQKKPNASTVQDLHTSRDPSAEKNANDPGQEQPESTKAPVAQKIGKRAVQMKSSSLNDKAPEQPLDKSEKDSAALATKSRLKLLAGGKKTDQTLCANARKKHSGVLQQNRLLVAPKKSASKIEKVSGRKANNNAAYVKKKPRQLDIKKKSLYVKDEKELKLESDPIVWNVHMLSKRKEVVQENKPRLNVYDNTYDKMERDFTVPPINSNVLCIQVVKNHGALVQLHQQWSENFEKSLFGDSSKYINDKVDNKMMHSHAIKDLQLESDENDLDFSTQEKGVCLKDDQLSANKYSKVPRKSINAKEPQLGSVEKSLRVQTSRLQDKPDSAMLLEQTEKLIRSNQPELNVLGKQISLQNEEKNNHFQTLTDSQQITLNELPTTKLFLQSKDKSKKNVEVQKGSNREDPPENSIQSNRPKLDLQKNINVPNVEKDNANTNIKHTQTLTEPELKSAEKNVSSQNEEKLKSETSSGTEQTKILKDSQQLTQLTETNEGKLEDKPSINMKNTQTLENSQTLNHADQPELNVPEKSLNPIEIQSNTEQTKILNDSHKPSHSNQLELGDSGKDLPLLNEEKLKDKVDENVKNAEILTHSNQPEMDLSAKKLTESNEEKLKDKTSTHVEGTQTSKDSQTVSHSNQPELGLSGKDVPNEEKLKDKTPKDSQTPICSNQPTIDASARIMCVQCGNYFKVNKNVFQKVENVKKIVRNRQINIDKKSTPKNESNSKSATSQKTASVLTQESKSIKSYDINKDSKVVDSKKASNVLDVEAETIHKILRQFDDSGSSNITLESKPLETRYDSHTSNTLSMKGSDAVMKLKQECFEDVKYENCKVVKSINENLIKNETQLQQLNIKDNIDVTPKIQIKEKVTNLGESQIQTQLPKQEIKDKIDATPKMLTNEYVTDFLMANEMQTQLQQHEVKNNIGVTSETVIEKTVNENQMQTQLQQQEMKDNVSTTPKTVIEEKVTIKDLIDATSKMSSKENENQMQTQLQYQEMKDTVGTTPKIIVIEEKMTIKDLINATPKISTKENVADFLNENQMQTQLQQQGMKDKVGVTPKTAIEEKVTNLLNENQMQTQLQQQEMKDNVGTTPKTVIEEQVTIEDLIDATPKMSTKENVADFLNEPQLQTQMHQQVVKDKVDATSQTVIEEKVTNLLNENQMQTQLQQQEMKDNVGTTPKTVIEEKVTIKDLIDATPKMSTKEHAADFLNEPQLQTQMHQQVVKDKVDATSQTVNEEKVTNLLNENRMQTQSEQPEIKNTTSVTPKILIKERVTDFLNENTVLGRLNITLQRSKIVENNNLSTEFIFTHLKQENTYVDQLYDSQKRDEIWFKDCKHMADLLSANIKSFNKVERDVTRNLLMRNSLEKEKTFSNEQKYNKLVIRKQSEIMPQMYFSQHAANIQKMERTKSTKSTLLESILIKQSNTSQKSFSTTNVNNVGLSNMITEQIRHMPNFPPSTTKPTKLNAIPVSASQNRQLQSSDIRGASKKISDGLKNKHSVAPSKSSLAPVHPEEEDDTTLEKVSFNVHNVDKENTKQILHPPDESVSEKLKHLRMHKAVLQCPLTKTVRRESLKLDDEQTIDPDDVKERTDILEINQKVFDERTAAAIAESFQHNISTTALNEYTTVVEYEKVPDFRTKRGSESALKQNAKTDDDLPLRRLPTLSKQNMLASIKVITGTVDQQTSHLKTLEVAKTEVLPERGVKQNSLHSFKMQQHQKHNFKTNGANISTTHEKKTKEGILLAREHVNFKRKNIAVSDNSTKPETVLLQATIMNKLSQPQPELVELESQKLKDRECNTKPKTEQTEIANLREPFKAVFNGLDNQGKTTCKIARCAAEKIEFHEIKNGELDEQCDFDILSELVTKKHVKIFGHPKPHKKFVVDEKRQPGGNHLCNQPPLYFKHTTASTSSLVSHGTIWNNQPIVPFNCNYEKHAKSKSRGKKYKYQTEEVQSTTGEKIKITRMVPDE